MKLRSQITNHIKQVLYSDRLCYQNLWYNTKTGEYFVVTDQPLPNPFILPHSNVFRFCTRRKRVFMQKWGDVVISKDPTRQHIKFIERIDLDNLVTDSELGSYNLDVYNFLTALGYGANKLKKVKNK